MSMNTGYGSFKSNLNPKLIHPASDGLPNLLFRAVTRIYGAFNIYFNIHLHGFSEHQDMVF
ncbi:MAG: hypothetical protein BWX80_01280 [Candidatus Hydrogenedentes bacterium ADurb.Bin101]|nr:MAG: hypothetical protein BWX80_01280 [Candidatus Hydrogenedentes bacterium ADurb.Bin101]